MVGYLQKQGVRLGGFYIIIRFFQYSRVRFKITFDWGSREFGLVCFSNNVLSSTITEV